MNQGTLETVDTLAKLAKSLYEDPYHAEGTFGSAEPLLARLEARASALPGGVYAREKLRDLRSHLGAMAGLNDGNGHSSRAHYVWSLSAMDVLRGSLCFEAPA